MLLMQTQSSTSIVLVVQKLRFTIGAVVGNNIERTPSDYICSACGRLRRRLIPANLKGDSRTDFSEIQLWISNSINAFSWIALSKESYGLSLIFLSENF